MIPGSVAKRYAKALVEVAAGSGALESVRQDLRALAVAERLLGRTIGGDDQKRLADQYVRELGGKN